MKTTLKTVTPSKQISFVSWQQYIKEQVKLINSK
jgi:hypothetical protein